MYRLMVADDERWIRKGIIKMIDIENLGISEVYESDNVAEALELFNEKRPDIVISDVRFPVEDGCTLCEKIYQISPGTQVIMISGYREFEYVKRALAYKAVDYLLKPVDKKMLNDTIGRCVEGIQKNKIIEDAGLPEGPDTIVETVSADKKAQENINKVMLEVAERIKNEYSRKFTLSDLAQEYYLSEAYFSAAFKKVVGIPLMNYIMEVRIEKAKELMLTSNLNVKKIAIQTGYSDQHYFAKIFKKLTGLSPKEYKAMIEKEIYEK